MSTRQADGDVNEYGSYRIARAHLHNHVTDEIVQRLEDEVSNISGWSIDDSTSELTQKYARFCVRRSMSKYFIGKRSINTFMVMMGTARIPLNAAEWIQTRGKRVAWLFDAWPDSYDDLLKFAKEYEINRVFVTAKQSAEHLRKVSGSHVFEWCPEPFIDLGFRTKQWDERQIDLLNFGRRYEKYNDALNQKLNNERVNYVTGEKTWKPLFPKTEDFIEGLASSKICVCVPRSLTNPQQAGEVSTMTQRYLQCMASGCVLIGTTPDEMIELMGYDPVIQIDLDDPAGQILEILENPTKYQPLIERNLLEVKNHSTESRFHQIQSSLP